MSLVSEALKKAEREAAALDARGKGQPAPFEAPLQPYRSRHAAHSRLPRWALFVGACLLAALGLGWWSSARKAPVKGVAPVSAVGLAVPTPTRAAPENPAAALEPPKPGPSTVGDGHAPAAPGIAPRQELAPPSDSESPVLKPAGPPLPKAAPNTSPPSPSISEPQIPRPAPSPAPSAPAREPSRAPGDYLRRADFPDGSSLELGGIVYSEAAPFAYINGRLVGVGEFVLGRRIDRIERDRVILSGDAGTITLRLKAP